MIKGYKYSAEFDQDLYMALKDSGAEYKIFIVFRKDRIRPLILKKIILGSKLSFVFSYFISSKGRVSVVLSNSGEILEGGTDTSKIIVGWNNKLINV